MPAGQHGVSRIGSLPGSVTAPVDRVGWLEDWRVGGVLPEQQLRLVRRRAAGDLGRAAAAAGAGAGLYVGVRLDPAGYGHTWREARQGIPYALAFASAHLGPALPVTAPPDPMGRLDRPSA
jgi:hypothetical protein